MRDNDHTASHTLSELPPRVAAATSPCFVAAAPELRAKMDAELSRLRHRKTGIGDVLGVAKEPRALGLNDGMILPPDAYPFGTPDSVMRNSGLDRAPLRGAVRVIVVLADTSDKPMATPVEHYRDLFFSEGVVATGSVREYFREVTGGLVDVVGEVVGPYRLPQTMAWYSNGNFGIGKPAGTTRARDLAADALTLADPHVDFGPYDNDANGFVDAYIVIHSGSGGEQTGNSGDIWSHKWVLAAPVTTDATQVYAYLTIPEDAKLGVSAHELGHLLFGFPDLYDTDGTSEGVGNWCLMGGGSWNGGGDTPAHPSAWCKVNQGWATVSNVTVNGAISIPDVKTSRQVHRLWKDGAVGQEYFLVENRQQTGFDADLPAGGLLVWHVDEAKPTNTDENHYKVGLLQADGLRNLETGTNRGDAGDPYPGTSDVTAISGSTTPNTNSYTGQATNVSVTAISPSAATMTATVTVRQIVTKDAAADKSRVADKSAKEIKDGRDVKVGVKERIDTKSRIKDVRDEKLFKDIKERVENKRPDQWPPTGGWDRFGRFGWGGFGAGAGDPYAVDPSANPYATDPYAADPYAGQAPSDPIESAMVLLEQALELLAAATAGSAEPFIDASLRPDLAGGPTFSAPGADPGVGGAGKRGAEGDPGAKRQYDTPQG